MSAGEAEAGLLIDQLERLLVTRADIGQMRAPAHTLTKCLYSVMLMTQFLS